MPAYPAAGPHPDTAAPWGAPPPDGIPPDGMPLPGVDQRRGVRTALDVLLIVSVLGLLLMAVARFQQYAVIGEILDQAPRVGDATARHAKNADDLFRTTNLLYLVVAVATVVLWVIWFRRARLNAEIFAPGSHRFGSGWAVGSWFTPVVNLWFPKQMANDIYRASAPGGPQSAPKGLLNSWWTVFLCASVSSTVLSMFYSALDARMRYAHDHYVPEDWEHDLRLMRVFSLLDAFALLLYAAAGVLALLVVRQLTALQERRAQLPPSLPPYGAAPYGAPYGSPYGMPYGPGGGPGPQGPNPYAHGPGY
ncbi:DUF4328 domain-containing protein [Streptomyces orinoci]|uniref:DUF4328 domain-containing protein n=1 Tax=Streptomyces orinoci TaxID=67339 RepID=A0ABV3JUB5_STRON|nr:DUF4328 domain-containing protein [Streptomyces orinoci]